MSYLIRTHRHFLVALVSVIVPFAFALAADFYSVSGSDRDNNVTSSLLYMAFAQGLVVDVKATGTWGTAYSMCGNPTGALFHNNAGDYIRIVRQ